MGCMTPPANVLGVFHRVASPPVGVHDDDVVGGLQGGDGRPVQADKVVAHGVYGAGEEGERGVSPVGHDECAGDAVQRGVLQAAGFDVEEGALGLLPGGVPSMRTVRMRRCPRAWAMARAVVLLPRPSEPPATKVTGAR